jgi:ABC-type spermidine/putrescine transport system permease subunit I
MAARGAPPTSDLASRILWPLLALPGVVWLALLFLVPFYSLLALTFSTELDYFGQPVPSWSPLDWDAGVFGNVVRESVDGIYTDSWIRTFWYCGLALSLIVVIGYPIAYYVARLDARLRGPLLLLLMAPWWINYLTRMLAWTGLLNDEGMVNRFLGFFGVGPVFWLAGRWWVVVIALVYGYLPYFVVPLYAYLDWIDGRHLEASRDLGANGVRTFLHVTLPLSRVGLMTSLAFVALPMFSDFYTNTLVSSSPATSMVGNQVVQTIYAGFSRAEGASLVLLLSALLAAVMAYYLVVTVRESREG